MTLSDPKLVAVLVLYSFLPLTFITYLLTRRRRRVIEVNRILTLLNINPAYRKAYEVEKPGYYFNAFMYVSVVTCAGLALLFLAGEIGLKDGEFPQVTLSAVKRTQNGAKPSSNQIKSAQSAVPSFQSGAPPSPSGNESLQKGDEPPQDGAKFPHTGSRLVFAMAFFGAYLWGLQYLFRRYSLNDLLPSVYYGMSVRMILAATVAVVIYNAGKALGGDGGGSDGGITDNIWPALAFVLGMFPQRGMRWLTERLPLFSGETDASVRKLPLEMIEGMEAHDVLRLEEQGVDSCYDLAAADFIPLILKTPYSARQLIDWILQAKLCVYVGDAVADLRKNGIRNILDLEHLDDDKKINELVAGTAVTEAAIRQAQAALKKHKDEIDRLQKAGTLLGTFWHGEPT